MSVLSRRKAPVLRVHTPSSQAYIFVRGKRLYLGRHDLPETVQKYHQVVAELLASGEGIPPVNACADEHRTPLAATNRTDCPESFRLPIAMAEILRDDLVW